MEKAFRILEKFNTYVGQAASFVLPALTFVMMYEVISRYLFNKPTVWSFELSVFLTGSLGALGGGYGLLTKAHVTVDIFYERFSPKTKAVMDIIAWAFLMVFVLALGYVAFPRAIDSFRRMEGTETPWSPKVWPMRFAIAIGSALLGIQATAKFIENVRFLITGKTFAKKAGAK